MELEKFSENNEAEIITIGYEKEIKIGNKKIRKQGNKEMKIGNIKLN